MAISVEASELVENFQWLTEAALMAATEVIKNTYRTLMTRGQKGCFIYCTDQETREYFQQIASRQLERAKPYQGYAPIFDLEIAAGGFSDQQFLENVGNPEESEWFQLPDHINTTQGMFVNRVVGESMNKRIINGSWCLFKANPGGSRNGKIVLVQHRDIEDPDHGGTYTVKTYHSEKIEEDDTMVNQRIVLKPETNAYGYVAIEINSMSCDVMVLGELLIVL
jgi:phage repressor protein C with HTH and peptisase S24 domain